jgi:hypothetical protein
MLTAVGTTGWCVRRLEQPATDSPDGWQNDVQMSQ